MVGRALHGDLDYAVDFCRAAPIDSSFVRFRAFRSKAEHDQFATRGTGASAVIPRLAARASQVGIILIFSRSESSRAEDFLFAGRPERYGLVD